MHNNLAFEIAGSFEKLVALNAFTKRVQDKTEIGLGDVSMRGTPMGTYGKHAHTHTYIVHGHRAHASHLNSNQITIRPVANVFKVTHTQCIHTRRQIYTSILMARDIRCMRSTVT